jgi:hypothetical protein
MKAIIYSYIGICQGPENLDESGVREPVRLCQSHGHPCGCPSEFLHQASAFAGRNLETSVVVEEEIHQSG